MNKMKDKKSLELGTKLCWGNFDYGSGLWVIQKIAFANLWNSILDAIIIPVSSDPLNLETLE